MSEASQSELICRILSLDGGGSKGFYTLGILREVEAVLPKPLHDTFDLIFGTSTGAIIAALLALGNSVQEIQELYSKYIPTIMRARTRKAKSVALHELGQKVFGRTGFDAVLTNVGIVSTKWEIETPMIFKSDVNQAHGRTASFVPGFGCSIAETVEASCSAFPFFQRKIVTTAAGNNVELFDGGYVANNPTLYAIADATSGLGHALGNCRVLSVGCGQYPEPRRGIVCRLKQELLSVRLLNKTVSVNTASMDQLRAILFRNVPTVRISDTFDRPEMATDMFEHDLTKLNLLFQQGGESFARREKDVRDLLIEEVA